MPATSQAGADGGARVVQWTVEEAHQRLQAGVAPLVDLRSAVERRDGGAPSALPLPMYDLDAAGRQRPVRDFAAALMTLARASPAPPMLICAQGLRSRQAAAWLVLQGVACDEVPGGFDGAEPELSLPAPLRRGWRAAGLPLGDLGEGGDAGDAEGAAATTSGGRRPEGSPPRGEPAASTRSSPAAGRGFDTPSRPSRRRRRGVAVQEVVIVLDP